MNTVRCPVCEQRLIGEDCEELTLCLREHLEKEHNIQELCNAPTGGVPPSTVAKSFEPPEKEYQERFVPSEEERERMRLGNRMREAELRREQEAWSPPEGSDVPPRTKGVGAWTRRMLGIGSEERPEASGEWREGEGYPDMLRRRRSPPQGPSLEEEYEKEPLREEGGPEREAHERPPEARLSNTVDCPMCGRHLMGEDEDELSMVLREHMVTCHEVAPLMAPRPRP